MAIVQFDNVSRIYTIGDHELRALDHVSFTLDEGKFVVILGPSGAGKSTLLNLLGGLDSPTEGTITVSGADISKLTDNEYIARGEVPPSLLYYPNNPDVHLNAKGYDLLAHLLYEQSRSIGYW